jgi:hypothetical protein
MKHRTTEEKLADDARLLRAWKKWHAEERAAAWLRVGRVVPNV